MSASSALRALLSEAPILWITSLRRAAAAAIAALLILAPVAMFELSEPWRLMARGDPRDGTPAETRFVAALAAAGAADVDVVMLLGGSTVREFTSSDARLSRLLTERCGRPIRFLNAGTSSQSLAESWAVAEAVPAARRRLVIVGMNYLRLEEGYEEVAGSLLSRRLPLPVPQSLRRMLADVGHAAPVTLPGLPATAWTLGQQSYMQWRGAPLPFAAFLASEDRSHPFSGPQNSYSAPALAFAEKRRIVRRVLAERLEVLRTMHGEATEMWKRFGAHFAASSTAVLFLVLPESGAMAPMDARAGEMLSRDLAAMARRGTMSADWRAGLDLPEDDFYDQQHLLASGRASVEPRFIDLVAGATPGCRR